MKRTYYTALGVLSGVGVAALLIRLVVGMNTTGLTSSISWGIWIALYIYFIGLSAGSFLLSSLIYVFGMKKFEKIGKLALLSALFSLGGALTFVWIDLGHPWRFWHAFTFPHFGSIMAIEMLLYLVYIVLIFMELYFLMREDLAASAHESTGILRIVAWAFSLGYRTPEDEQEGVERRQSARAWVKVLGVIGVPVAVGVHGGTGAIFGVVGARPYWFGGMFPIVFLVSALASGAALVTFLHALFGDREDTGYMGILKGLAQLTAIFISIDLLLVVSEILTGLYGGSTDQVQAWRAVMFGRYAPVFWIGQVGLAGVVSLLLIRRGLRRDSRAMLGWAGALTVIGVIAIRLNIVIPGYVVPELPGLDKAYQGPRLAYTYFPSALEWIVSIGMVALGILLFSLAFEHLPVVNRRPKEVAA